MVITMYKYEEDTPKYYTISLVEERRNKEKTLRVCENQHLPDAICREIQFSDRQELADLVEKLLQERLELQYRMLFFYTQSSRLHSLITDTVRNYRDLEEKV